MLTSPVSSSHPLEIPETESAIVALPLHLSINQLEILNHGLEETRARLQTDRVIIYRVLPNGDGVVFAESVGSQWTPILGQLIYDPCLKAAWIERYRQGQTTSISDTHAGNIEACYVELLDRVQVRANLVVPILNQGNLWGLLIAHHCKSLRKWQSQDVQLLQKMAIKLGNAMMKAGKRGQKLHQSEVKLELGTLEHQEKETDIIKKKPLTMTVPESTKKDSTINHSAHESERLERLRRYEILDTPPDGAFDRVTAIAARFLQVPIALVSLVDQDRIWFKSHYGLDVEQIDRESGLCASAIWQDDVYEIPNTLEDPRAMAHPLVSGPLGLRFYAAAPLKTHDGYNLGTLCVIDKHPRQLSPEEKDTLADLAAMVMDEMELRLSARKLIEQTEAQRESEERWQLALRGNNDGIWDWNVKTNEVFFSNRWKEMLGFEEHEISNHLDEWSKRVHPDDLDFVKQLMFDHFAKKTPFYISEHRVLCKDGSYKWILDRGQALWDEAGNVIRMCGSHTDISERKYAEFERRELIIALENAVSGISQLDTQGRYLFVNQSYANAAGYQPEEMIGMLWPKTVHPDDLEKLIAAYQQMLKDGKVELEARGIRKDGSSFYKQLVMISIYDDQQQFIGHHCFMKDITDRKEAEKALQKSQSLLSEAQRIAHIGNWDHDITTGKITWSHELFGILGRDPALGEPTYQEYLGLYPPEEAQQLHQKIERALCTGESFQLRLRMIKPNGSIRHTETRGQTELNAEGKVIRFFGTTQDITELVEAETALQEEFQRLSVVIATQQEIAIRNPNIDEVMAVIVERTQQLTSANGSIMKMVEGDELVCRAASGTALPHVGFRLQVAKSLAGQCIKSGKIIYCHDVETDSYVDIAVCRRIGIRSMVLIPLFYKEEVVGVLNVFSSTPSAFNESDIQTLQLMAGFLAATLHLASEFDAKNILLSELEESEQRYRSVITSMREGIVLQLADGQITAFNPSAERILGLTPDEIMGRTSVDMERRTIKEDGSPFPGQEHPAMVTLRTGQPVFGVVMGICKSDREITWISINSQPLLYPHQSQPYAVVTTFADITEQKQVEEILRNQAEWERLMATTDGLTQVTNRRGFDERLQSEWLRLMRGQQELSLIMLDVDFFKRYNDCYGHQAGDICLVQVARAAAQAVKRSSDLFVRYGGEEFAVILPNTDAAGAIAVAEFIQQAIRDLKIPHHKSDVSEFVTVSMGIATIIPSFGTSSDELVARADKALYSAKQLGRDRYSCCPPGDPQGCFILGKTAIL
jgi:diguanylate cyclase (GGDEF)-like protein/PAS domain S-box-containing protein